MQSDTIGSDDMEQSTTRQERRQSLGGRAFAKIKDALRRRSSKGDAVTAAASQSNAETPAEAGTAAPATTEGVSASEPRNANTATSAHDSSTIPDATSKAPVILESGDVIEVGETDDPLVSILAARPGITAARMRAVFDKYGVNYESRTGAEDEHEKLRRVEKAIRVRIHWECHECKTDFRTSKTCEQCGHRRCKECPRSPAKRVKEALAGTKQMDQLEDQMARSNVNQESIIVPVTAEQESVIAPIDEGSLEKSGAEPIPANLEPDDTAEKYEIAANGSDESTRNKYVLQRPRAGLELMHHRQARIVRRNRHECGTHFKSASPTVHCMCPNHPSKPKQWPCGPSGDEARMVPMVQRVYRKPKLRVRWYCHQCQTLFVNRERCLCGHVRCGACIRTP